jgi:hypothetical protein
VGYPQPTIYPRQGCPTRQTALKYIQIKFLLFLHVFRFISNEYDKIKCFKKSGCRVDTRIFQLVSGILSVVGIPPEEIQLLMYDCVRDIGPKNSFYLIS